MYNKDRNSATSFKYRSREDEVRATLSEDKVVNQIILLGGVPDYSNTSFDLYDQLLACESIHESHPVEEKTIKDELPWTERDAVGNGDVNGSCKRIDNFELTSARLQAVATLKTYDYRTPPPLIAEQLSIIFNGFGTQEGWWLRVAQTWNPRAICREIRFLIKQHTTGWKTIRNPASYFTSRILRRKKRRGL